MIRETPHRSSQFRQLGPHAQRVPTRRKKKIRKLTDTHPTICQISSHKWWPQDQRNREKSHIAQSEEKLMKLCRRGKTKIIARRIFSRECKKIDDSDVRTYRDKCFSNWFLMMDAISLCPLAAVKCTREWVINKWLTFYRGAKAQLLSFGDVRCLCVLVASGTARKLTHGPTPLLRFNDLVFFPFPTPFQKRTRNFTKPRELFLGLFPPSILAFSPFMRGRLSVFQKKRVGKEIRLY